MEQVLSDNNLVISVDAMGGDKSPRIVIEGLAISAKKNPSPFRRGMQADAQGPQQECRSAFFFPSRYSTQSMQDYWRMFQYSPLQSGSHKAFLQHLQLQAGNRKQSWQNRNVVYY